MAVVNKIPPPPPVAQRDPELNRWFIELTAILNGQGQVVTTAVTQPPGTNNDDIATCSFVLQNTANSPSTAVPLMDSGTGAVGTSGKFAREDHVHPVDTSRAPLASPTFTGTPAAPTPITSDNSTKLATTQYVQANTGLLAPLVSPAFTGTPVAPTPATADSSTKLATTAYVQANAALLAPLASPTLTGDPKAPTPAPGDNDTSIATTAFVTAALAAAPTVRNGTTAPAGALGNVNDWYADTVAKHIYVKTASATWTLII